MAQNRFADDDDDDDDDELKHTAAAIYKIYLMMTL
jgi:hypothetical protein